MENKCKIFGVLYITNGNVQELAGYVSTKYLINQAALDR